jgi:GTP-binding protein EngB required for normal cell division
MNHKSITTTLGQTLAFLEEDGPVLLRRQDREKFIQRTLGLVEKARYPGEVLYVGILGGTGVGKSTLINALAGEEISSPSDRRPFTDKAVVYRHKNTSRKLDELARLLREPDALHESDAVKDMVLLDLPDFDSFKTEHRRIVQEIVPKLDCIVWVVSPEKYADEVFYQLVREMVMNRDNFTFVLNKADELRQAGHADPYGRFKEVLGDLVFRLKAEGGIEDPRVFILSAAHEFLGADADPILEKEFDRFRDFLMVRRDGKEIASVKANNLLEETSRLLADLNAKVRPDEVRKSLGLVREIEGQFSRNDRMTSLASAEQEERLHGILMPTLLSADSSIGPVKLAMGLMAAARSIGVKLPKDSNEEFFQDAAEALSRGRLSNLQRLEAQIGSEFMLLFGRQEEAVTGDRAAEIMASTVRRAVAGFGEKLDLTKRSMFGFFGGFRRFGQKMVLLVPVLVFLLKMVGHSRIEAWIDRPTVLGAFNLIAAALSSLFSADGLVGLLVLLICDILLVLYLASRRMKNIEKRSRELAVEAIKSIEAGLQAAEDQARTARTKAVQRIEDGLGRLEALEASLS